MKTHHIIRYSNTYLGYPLLYSFVYLCSLLPFAILYAIADVVYFLAYKVFRYRYKVVLQNLSRSLPEKSYTEINSITGKFYRYFSRLFVEIVKLTSIDEKELRGRVKILNPELLEDYHRQQRSIIAVLGHYGNWEYLNILPRQVSFGVNAVYKPLTNSSMDTLIKRVRGRFGMRLLSMQQVSRYMLLNKHKPELYLFIADQFPGADAKCRVNFLHQQTSMFNGAEKLAKATNAVVVYMDVKQAEDRYWEIKCSLLTDQPAQTSSDEITRSFAAHLQESIQEAPQYWLWTHRRWKDLN